MHCTMTKIVSLMTQRGEEGIACSERKSKKSSSSGKGRKDSPSKKMKELALTTKGYERHHVKHNYHDYARTAAVPNPLELDIEGKASGGVNNPFPTVLHKLLSDTDPVGFSDVISWQPHGRSFLIHKPKEFVKDIVPRYFKHSKLSSFQRQLSLYGFVRLTNEGPDKGSYYHEMFLRGRAFLCSKIQRTRIKGTWVRTSSSPESEPDFLSMDPVQDLVDQSASPPATTHLPANFVSPKSSPLVTSGQGQEYSQQSSLEHFGLLDAPIILEPQQAGDTAPIASTDTALLSTIAPLPLPPALLNYTFPSFTVSSFGRTTEESRDYSPSSHIPPIRPPENGDGLPTREFQWLHQKRYSCDVPSLASLSRAVSYPVFFEDDELGTFLSELDLGLELEKAEDLLQTAMI